MKKTLGMEISRDRHFKKLFLSQQRYILERFEMQESKPIITPLAIHFKLSISNSPKNEEEERYMSKVPYSSVVKKLMFSMLCTYPNIPHVVSDVSKYMAKLAKLH